MSYNPQIGVEVTFINRGVPMTGVVTKHNPKTVSVDIKGRVWRVPRSLLVPPDKDVSTSVLDHYMREAERHTPNCVAGQNVRIRKSSRARQWAGRGARVIKVNRTTADLMVENPIQGLPGTRMRVPFDLIEPAEEAS